MRNFNYDIIQDPVKEYESRYRDEFSNKAAALFEDIVNKSGVSEEANEKLVNEINHLQEVYNSSYANSGSWGVLYLFLIIVLIIGIIMSAILVAKSNGVSIYIWLTVAWVLGGFFWFKGTKYTVIRIDFWEQECSKTKSLRDAKNKEAWDMMLPLNRQFQWENINNLITQTLPIFEIDRFLSKARLNQLLKEYDFDEFGNDCSVKCCQSGSLNGNPWVLFDVTSQDWEDVTYEGSKTISYLSYETYTDSKGSTRFRFVTKKQTLYATHTEKAPRYTRKKVLVYGLKDDVEKLSFSRVPVNVAGDSIKEDEKKKELLKLSRDFIITVMSNDTFEASFYAIDRTDEADFRKVFDASAQAAIYNLLKDKKVGYGDDFSFKKKGKINILISEHMNKTNISCNPKKFHHFNLKKARDNFMHDCEDYFRSFFFTFAPLFCSDVYQNHTWLEDTSPTDIDKSIASTYECEALAYYMGENTFAPKNAQTQILLKAKIEDVNDKTASVNITADAFTVNKRCIYVPKWGNDLVRHKVPVYYDEYIPVSKDTQIKVINPETEDSIAFDDLTKTKEWSDYIELIGADSKTQVYRRGLAAFKSK